MPQINNQNQNTINTPNQTTRLNNQNLNQNQAYTPNLNAFD